MRLTTLRHPLIACAVLTILPAVAAHGQSVRLISRAEPSLASDTAGGVLDSTQSVSADGRYVAFTSPAKTLVAGQVDANGLSDVFLFDRQTGTRTLVSHVPGSLLTTGDADSFSPAITSDGSLVAFASVATNLAAGQVDTNLGADLFVFERATGLVTLVSHRVGAANVAGDWWAGTFTMSADGAFISFQSAASDLVAGDTNADGDVFLWRRATNTATVVSHDALAPTQTANGFSSLPTISGNGAYVAFTSIATNLVAGQSDTPGTEDVFLFERATGTIRLVSRRDGTSATAGNGTSYQNVINGDGRYVAFLSSATDLVPGVLDVNLGQDVVLYDRVADSMTLVTHNALDPLLTADRGAIDPPVLDASGRFVVFLSAANNLAVGQIEPIPFGADIFVYDRTTGENALITHQSGAPTTAANESSAPQFAISADGAFVAYSSPATNLVSGQVDLNVAYDVFVCDRATGTTSLVTRRAGTVSEVAPVPVALGSPLSLSADGGFLAFTSQALDLVSGLLDQDNAEDVFLFDRLSGTSVAASRRTPSPPAPPSVTGSGDSRTISASADGRFVAFEGEATNLVPGQVDENFGSDVYLYDRLTGTVTLVSHQAGLPATTGDGVSGSAALSANGAFVTFSSWARNLVAGQVDPTSSLDVFLWERATGVTRLVSHAASIPLQAANGGADYNAVIDGTGSFVAFRSPATNLVSGQVNNTSYNVFLFDRATGDLTLVSRQSGAPATTANGTSRDPVISGNGASVAFTSFATNLVAGQVDAARGAAGDDDVFVFERATSTMRMVSRNSLSAVTTGNGRSLQPTLSGDGSWVGFRSQATNLVAGQVDVNNNLDVFLYHWPTGTMTLVSHVPASPVTAATGGSTEVKLSGDGGYLAFTFNGPNLVTGQTDANGDVDVFLFDRVGGTVSLVSRRAGTLATTGDGYSDTVAISDDGAKVAFRSYASNLVAGQIDGVPTFDVFLHDRPTATNTLVSRALATTTTTGDDYSDRPIISGNGGFVAFTSFASNLVAGDINQLGDSFLFTVAPTSADLSIVKDDGSSTAVPGTGVAYAITVQNAGPDPAIAAPVVDNPPAILTGVTWTCAATPGSICTASGASAISDFADLMPGGSATYTLSATIDPSATGLLTNTATVAAPAGATDPVPGNNSASDADTLSPAADLTVGLADAPDPVAVGGTLTYTATARNIGPSTATNATVVVAIPTGTTFSSVVPPTCTPGASTVTCTVASLPPGGSFPVVLQVTVGTGAAITGGASVLAGAEPDPDLSNNSASVTTTVLSPAVLMFTVSAKNGANTLEWLNSLPGLPTVIVASSTQCPVDPSLPTDGDRPAGGYLFSGTVTGTRGTFPDPGLTNGQTYYYAAFIDTGGGTFSAGRCATGRPFDNGVGQPEEAVRWAFGTAATAVTPPGVGGSAVFAVSNDRGFHAMGRGPTGGTWPTGFAPLLMGEPAQSRPPVVPTTAIAGASRVVFLGSQDGTVYAVNADVGGAPLLQSGALGDAVQAAPAGMFTAFGGAYDLLLVGSRTSGADNVFEALNVGDFTSAWQYGGPGDPFGIVSGGASVDYPARRVTFASRARGATKSTLRSLSFTDTGWTEEWKAVVGDVDGSPTVAGGVVYVGNNTGVVHARDAALGTAKWTFPTGGGPVKGFVFPDRQTGDRYLSTTSAVWGLVDQGLSVVKKWPEITSIPNPSIPLFVRLGATTRLYVGSSDGRLYEIDAATGTITSSILLGGGGAVVGAPSFDSAYNLVYVGSDRGVIYAVQAPLP